MRGGAKRAQGLARGLPDVRAGLEDRLEEAIVEQAHRFPTAAPSAAIPARGEEGRTLRLKGQGHGGLQEPESPEPSTRLIEISIRPRTRSIAAGSQLIMDHNR
jgi:hypothetical protein